MSAGRRRFEIVRVPADETGASRLAALQTRTFHEAYESEHGAADLEAYCAKHYTPGAALAELRSAGSICRLGLLDDRLSGYYIVRQSDPPLDVGFRCYEIKQIYARRDAHGTGLGRALYDDAVEQIRRRGVEGVWLCVSDRNLRARAFYDKLGFRAFGPGPTLEVGAERLPSTVMAVAIGNAT